MKDSPDKLARFAYRQPVLKQELRRFVRTAGSLNLRGDARDRMQKLQRQAESLATLIRKKRKDYETYLYIAIGRKVDFEEVRLDRAEGGVQYNVYTKYIIQKGTSEPMAPRFYIDIRVVPKDDEFEEGVDLTLNAGFINAIGMKHAKFTQADFDPDKLNDPVNVFSWIEYLEGDFLKAQRLVRPFGDGQMDMGIK